MQNETEKNLTKSKRKTIPWISIGILCSTFAIIVLLIVGALVFRNLFEINQQLLENQSNTKAEIDQLKNQLTETQNHLNNEMGGIKQSIDQVTELQKGNQEAIAFAYVRYLVKLANDYLQYTKNIPLTIQLLQSADQELRTLSNPKYMQLRQTLANDIAHLQSTPVLDMDGIYARLNALQNEIDQLPMITSHAVIAKEVKSTEESMSWWKKGLINSWASLQQLVQIRYNDHQTIPLLPEQEVIIRQNLRALVNQAVWGLLNGQQDIYLSAIDQIQVTVKKYFESSDPMTQALIMQTDSLKNLYIRPATPKIASIDQFSVGG